MKAHHIFFTALSVLTVTVSAPADEVSIEQQGQRAVIRIGDDVLGVYQFGHDLPKPFMLPLTAPGGLEMLTQAVAQGPANEFDLSDDVFVVTNQAELKVFNKTRCKANFGDVLTVGDVSEGWLWIPEKDAWIHIHDVAPLAATVTRLIDPPAQPIKDRSHPRYYDHPHHKGVWVAVDEVNGIPFWAEDGVIRTQQLKLTTPRGNPAVMHVTNHWLDKEGTLAVIEQTEIRIHANRLLEYRITFQAPDHPVTFDDTKEGMFGIRLPNSMREMISGGPIVNTEGVIGSKACWGKPSAWIDYAGKIGKNQLGVTLMDASTNPRKSRYHVRNYGLFSINPFGTKAYTKGSETPLDAEPLELEPKQSVTFRYGLYVHRGDAKAAGIPDVYNVFNTAK